MRRKASILAALALLALVTVPIADAAITKPLMTVEGNVLVTFDGDASDPGSIWRFEIRTLESGKVEFGYFQTLFPNGESEATVETVKFFTAPSGGKTAEFTGTECRPGENPWCNPIYLVQVTDNAGRGVPDTVCGGRVGEGCLWRFTVTSGDIRIFSQQQR